MKPKKGWEQFLMLCLTTKEHQKLKELFDLFFTPEERDNFALRYMILKELLENKKTQRDIAKELNVSIAKITRGSNELKRLNPKILKLLEKAMLE